MSKLNELMDSNNKVKYDDLRDLIISMPLAEYMKEIGMPFLIGKELFEGNMSKDEGASDTSTMRFSVADVQASLAPDTQTKENNPSASTAISRAVYVVSKNANSDDSRRDCITIGRSSANDVTIADYVISKKHAVIQSAAGRFFIEDLGATNGVKVDGAKINVGEKVQLLPGSEVSFGRYCFVFTKPIELFNKVRKEVMGK